ncbi:hypothetical protein OL229_07990 [Neisseriaceae bacterium JH1-16]|nr:hypothetical protein [Neisseriaceae bacterium JH1-16]
MSLFIHLLNEPLHGQRDEEPLYRHDGESGQSAAAPFPDSARTVPNDELSLLITWLHRLRTFSRSRERRVSQGEMTRKSGMDKESMSMLSRISTQDHPSAANREQVLSRPLINR